MNSIKINKYFYLAKNVSKLSDFPRQHLGAVIVQGGMVISAGYNTVKENPIQKHYNSYRKDHGNFSHYSLHAEMMALLRLKGLSDSVGKSKKVIFIYREFKNGNSAMARPCEACLKALADYGITSIYYTISPPDGTDFAYCYEDIGGKS